MRDNGVKVFVCVCLFLCDVLLGSIDAGSIRQMQNSVLNDAVKNISSDSTHSPDIVVNHGTTLLMMLSTDAKEKGAKRALPVGRIIEECKLEKCNAKNALEIDGDEDGNSSFEMAESHIFRPLFRARIRKATNNNLLIQAESSAI